MLDQAWPAVRAFFAQYYPYNATGGAYAKKGDTERAEHALARMEQKAVDADVASF